LYLAGGKTCLPTIENYIAFVGIFLNFKNFCADNIDWNKVERLIEKVLSLNKDKKQ
jgi:hypothetical protein